MARMRTVTKAVKEYKDRDPESPVSVTTLRRWVKEGRIKYVMSGNTVLVNMESLEEFLSGRDA